MKNLVVGITGGIGSGKSTVSEIIEKEKYQVLISDDIAREIMNNDDLVIKKIQDEFGEECYSNGNLNPKVLAEKVFNDSRNLEKINSIVHPPTINKIKKTVTSLKKTESIIFVESALIFEANFEDMFDYIILVTADEEIRINRILQRGVETVEEIKKRISKQLSEEQKKSRSQFVIENNSSIEALKEKTMFFINLLSNLI